MHALLTAAGRNAILIERSSDLPLMLLLSAVYFVFYSQVKVECAITVVCNYRLYTCVPSALAPLLLSEVLMSVIRSKKAFPRSLVILSDFGRDLFLIRGIVSKLYIFIRRN